MEASTSSQETTIFHSLRLERNGPLVEVVLIGPGKGNAMGPDFWREMPEVFASLDQDEQVCVIIIRGEGKHFSYGLDLVAMLNSFGPHLNGQNLAPERMHLLDTIGKMQQAVTSVAECRKPVIAAISGWCIGGGLDLITACDVRLCSSEARFSVREVKVAMVADIGSLQRLPYIIGEGHTRELAFTGKDIDAAHAMRIGLVNDVFETQEQLLEAAHELARQIAENPPIVVQGIKRVLDERNRDAVADGLRYVALWNSAFLQSQDLTEAFSAFAERRTPHFQGR
jgi:enoyl-CoA hydratase